MDSKTIQKLLDHYRAGFITPTECLRLLESLLEIEPEDNSHTE